MADEEALDVGDKEQVKRRKTRAKNQEQREKEELRAILSTYGGRAFVWKLLSRCQMFNSIAIDNALHLAASTALGNYGKILMADILTADPKSYTLMRDEAVSRDTEGGP